MFYKETKLFILGNFALIKHVLLMVMYTYTVYMLSDLCQVL